MTQRDSVCCAASRDEERHSEQNRTDTPAARTRVGNTSPAMDENKRTDRMVHLNGGMFTMGTDEDIGFAADGEGPARDVTLDPFYIDRFAVTNAEFLQFVRATDYTTDAERFGWSFVFRDFVASKDEHKVIEEVSDATWWVAVKGANWLRPEGPGSTVGNKERLKHPVTHISWNDAQAYAKWAKKRLPTEAEWEFAARGGLEEKRYPWGDQLRPDGEHRCNIWQGEFPAHNTGDDGYHGTAPVSEFSPNEYGLYNVSGNVWEWCADWFSADYHITDSSSRTNPTGPSDGTERVMRGGSYLCHRSWCNRYRVAARSKNTPNSSTGNIGFRCVVDPA